MTAAFARRPRRDDPTTAVVAALRGLKPDLGADDVNGALLWIALATHDAILTAAALDHEADAINRMLARLRVALDCITCPPDPARPLICPGRDAWLLYRQALFRASGGQVLLPEDPSVMVQAVDMLPRREHARLGSRRGLGQVKRAVANTCAGLYFSLTNELPPVRHTDGPWGRLLDAVFTWQDLGAFKKIGREAACELHRHMTPKPGENSGT